LILLKQRYGLLNSDNDAPPGTKSVLLEIYSTDLNREGTVETVDRGAPRRHIEGNVMLYNGGVISDNGSSPVVKEILCDTVFHLEGGTLRPEYIFDPGRYTIPAEAFGESPSVPWSDDFHLFTSLMEGEKYLIVQTQNGRPVRSGFLVVDKSEPAGGFSATGGPDGKPGLFIGGVAFRPMYVRDNRLVGYMQALDIVDGAAAITNPALKAIANTLKEDGNPVIVVATLKK
jgi:hypothetical protein